MENKKKGTRKKNFPSMKEKTLKKIVLSFYGLRRKLKTKVEKMWKQSAESNKNKAYAISKKFRPFSFFFIFYKDDSAEKCSLSFFFNFWMVLVVKQASIFKLNDYTLLLLIFWISLVKIFVTFFSDVTKKNENFRNLLKKKIDASVIKNSKNQLFRFRSLNHTRKQYKELNNLLDVLRVSHEPDIELIPISSNILLWKNNPKIL